VLLKQRLGKFAFLTMLCSALVAIFFREHFLSGLDLYGSSRTDGVTQIDILEHWFRVFHGTWRWDTPPWFYPSKGILGYNDGYFIYGLIYTPLRLLGFDRFQASEYTNVVIKIIGFFSFYYVCRKPLGLSFVWAAFGSSLFFILNGYFIRDPVHAQLYAVNFVPLALIFLYRAAIAFSSDEKIELLLFGIGFGLLYGAWLLTTGYMAWFFALFFLFAVPVYFLQLSKPTLLATFVHGRENVFVLMVIAIALVASASPFLLVYLPVASSVGAHDYSSVQQFSPGPFDIFNLGPDNLFYGALLSRLSLALQGQLLYYSELSTGFTPLLLAVFFGASAVGLLRADSDKRITLVRTAIIATLMTWLLLIQFGPIHGWRIIYDYFPGAKSVRAVARYELFLGVFIVLVSVFYLSRISGGRLTNGIVVAIAAWLLLEQWNTGGYWGLSRSAENVAIDKVQTPPAQCRSFFVATARHERLLPDVVDGIYNHNVDAMTIATKFALPTINGFASSSPAGWNLNNPRNEDYLDRVLRYAKSHSIIDGLCSLDMSTGHWNISPFLDHVVPNNF